MRKNFHLNFVLFGLLLLTACTSGTSEKNASATSAPFSGLSTVRLDPVVLESILPDAMMGMPKKIATKGEPKMDGGAMVSMARNIFKDGEGREIQIAIYDSGTDGHTLDTYLDWVGKTVNTDTEGLYEKSGTFEGFPSYEKYLKREQTGELHVQPSRRFEIVVKGKNVSAEELRGALKNWNVKNSLARLK